MKKTIFLACLSLIVLNSCSSDDTSAAVIGDDYLPLEIGNYWTYDVTGAPELSGRDSLFVAKDTVINTKTYKKFKTLAIPFGSLSSSLNNNAVRKENGKLLLSGSTGFYLGDDIPFDLSLNDFVVFKENASDNEQLASLTGTINQQLQELPLSFTYILKTTAGTSIAVFTAADGTVYNDVKTVKTVLNLKITVEIAGFNLPVMNNQDVVVSTQYYAKNIGVVYTDTTISYNLEDIAGQFGIPTTYSQNQKEYLDTYHL